MALLEYNTGVKIRTFVVTFFTEWFIAFLLNILCIYFYKHSKIFVFENF